MSYRNVSLREPVGREYCRPREFQGSLPAKPFVGTPFRGSVLPVLTAGGSLHLSARDSQVFHENIVVAPGAGHQTSPAGTLAFFIFGGVNSCLCPRAKAFEETLIICSRIFATYAYSIYETNEFSVVFKSIDCM